MLEDSFIPPQVPFPEALRNVEPDTDEETEIPEQLFNSGDEAPAIPEELLNHSDQPSSLAEETPSMMVNPSSHHDIASKDIETVTPSEPSEELETIQPENDKEDGDETLPATDDIHLPVITIPTPNSTKPTSKPFPNEASNIPVPPILASLVKNKEEWHEDQELDHLIEELESARIIPKPDHEHIEAPLLEDDIDDMVSETLARILEGQKQYSKAADMYEKLADIHPERSKKFQTKAAELRDTASNTAE